MKRSAPTHVELTIIGVIHSPFRGQRGAPIQPAFDRDAVGQVEVFEPYAEGLVDLEGFERVWLLFVLDRARDWTPRVTPYLDDTARGVFATRAPARPCPIGMSVVELVSVRDRRLEVRGLDVLDGTPLLDIKPYVPRFDAFPSSRAGWLDAVGERVVRADARFAQEE